ncbi:MAG: alpha/beta hydrolase [Chloroflexi bacterium]|nr:alpha/beta hydrolase [Chloroflexota bacterium]
MEQKLTLGTTELHYLDTGGPGPALVLLHGLNESLTSYRAAVDLLAGMMRVLAPDLRGHGRSSWVPDQYRVQDYAADIIAFLAEVVGEPVVLAGHSLGGLMAAYIASRPGPAPRGLVLEDPPLFTAQMPALQDTPFYPIFVQTRDLLRAHHQRAGTVDDLVEIVGQWPANESQTILEAAGEQFTRQFAWQLHHSDPETLTVTIDGRLFGAFAPETDLPRVQCPTLLLAGTYERGGAMEAADVQAAARLLPACSYAVWDDAGHSLHEQFPERYVQAVQTFLEQRGVL